MKPQNKTRQLTAMAMLTAISIVLVYLVHFPIFPAAPFLEYDPADIPIFLGTFLYGPAAGLLMTVVVSVIQGVTVSSASGPIGILMHIFATGSFVLAMGTVYRHTRDYRKAVVGSVFGVLAMTVAMVIWNLIFTPLFGVPRDAVVSLLVPAIIPFNLIKAGGNAAFSLILYRILGRFIAEPALTKR